MNITNDLIDRVTSDEMASGISEGPDGFSCLACGKKFPKDEIMQFDGKFLFPRAAALRHVESEHPDYFNGLISAAKQSYGLSETQAEVISAKYEGTADKETAKQYGKSEAAIRNMRFQLKRKAREAKIFLGIMKHLEQHSPDQDTDGFITFAGNLTISDDRTIVTREEERRILGKYVTKEDGLVRFPKKEKEKLVILNHIVGSFEPGKSYGEKEINTVLARFQDDYVTLRRYLIEYGFFDRTPDGASYWRK